MTAAKTPPTIQYPGLTLKRAERAMRCSPFSCKLFVTMISQSVALSSIAGRSGVANQYTNHPMSELLAETELLWLIQVGLLRREVDGQGLTDSFRVTPLGRQLAQKWQEPGMVGRYTPTVRDRVNNALTRWLRLPI